MPSKPEPLYVPSDEEIRAKAAELGLDLTARGARARAARAVAADRAAPAPERGPTRPEAVLLSRTVSPFDGGQIVVDVHWIPKENRDDDHAEDQHRDDPRAARG